VVYQLEDIAKRHGHKLNVIRMTIVECAQRLHLDENDFSLYADKRQRVAVVHMAYGYILEHFPPEKEWKMRLDMERSTAILSPNIRVQLSSSKKIQQLLAQPGVMERYLPNAKEQVDKLIKIQAGLWGLDNQSKEIEEVVKQAIKTPGRFVLKSQLEAGKGNFFDEEISDKLSTMDFEERSAYILMEKINPVVMKNYMIRPFAAPKLENIVSEASIYGSFIGNSQDGSVVLNNVDGHLVRTKPSSHNQGGVCAGSGGIDSVLLFPSNQFTPTTASK